MDILLVRNLENARSQE